MLAAVAAFMVSLPDRSQRWLLLPVPTLVLWVGTVGYGCLAGLLAERGAQLTAGIAMGRLGKPEDIASIVRYLAVDAHMYMTGQHFVVDGFQWSC